MRTAKVLLTVTTFLAIYFLTAIYLTTKHSTFSILHHRTDKEKIYIQMILLL